MEKSNSSSATAPTGQPARRGGSHKKSRTTLTKQERRAKKLLPKITKEERRAKYTSIARDRRQAHVQRARDKGLVCYRCRRTGHTAEECTADATTLPSAKKQGGGLCYKCGSVDHRIQRCPEIAPFLARQGKGKLDFGKLGDLPFANCYVCHKAGHLAGNCPDSKTGVYPKGGACRECGSVDHYAADCPERKNRETRADDGGSDDASHASAPSVTIDHYLEEPAVCTVVKKVKSVKKKKVVNF